MFPEKEGDVYSKQFPCPAATSCERRLTGPNESTKYVLIVGIDLGWKRDSYASWVQDKNDHIGGVRCIC
ncbi:hypothetical protein J32TS6_03690 [Virgibacillus pantothenticus]|nr:hypothetical protein J32TS6_03690 [Virgibacillus pantothenticus]